MSFSDYSTNPNDNTTIGGVNVAEECSPAGLNNAIRQLAADGKELSDSVAGLPTSKLDKAGGVLTGQISRDTRGGYLHFASSSFTDGRVHLLAEGASNPSSPAEGWLVFFYQ